MATNDDRLARQRSDAIEKVPRAAPPPMYDSLAVTRIPVQSVKPGLSPRILGENIDHIHALAEVIDCLPPIVVHRSTMRIIDGVHRWRAAAYAGWREIAVQYFDGSDEEALILALALNLEHGLPLSTADRRSAAARLLHHHPDWSDRRVAKAAGLSPKTVARVRSISCDHEGVPRRITRVGSDGRRRALPLPRTSTLLEDPGFATSEACSSESPTQVQTGNTVRAEQPNQLDTVQLTHVAFDGAAAFASLCNDPSLRSTETGRLLLRLLGSRSLTPGVWHSLILVIPPYQRHAVASIAEEVAAQWCHFATRIREWMPPRAP